MEDMLGKSLEVFYFFPVQSQIVCTEPGFKRGDGKLKPSTRKAQLDAQTSK